MPITNVPGADEKNAALSLKLQADSGYRANSTGHRVSANQWAAILSICDESKTGKTLMLAPEMIDALTQIEHAESVEIARHIARTALSRLSGEVGK